MIQEFKLKGLNGRGSNGAYATVDMDNEDWFHADFDKSVFPVDRQCALFNYFKDGDDTIWKDNKDCKVVVRFERWSTGGVPVNPIIIGIKNLN